MGISAPVVGTVTASVLDPANNAVVTAHKAFDFSMGPVVAVFNRLPLTSFFAGERSRFEVSAHSLRQRQVGLTKLHRSASAVISLTPRFRIITAIPACLSRQAVASARTRSVPRSVWVEWGRCIALLTRT